MVGVRNDHQGFVSRQTRNHLAYSRDGTVLIVFAVHEKFGLRAIRQEREVAAVHGNAQPDQPRHANVRAARAQTNPRAKTKTRKQQSGVGTLARIGTFAWVGTFARIGTIAWLGTFVRIGTIAWLGTFVRIGTFWRGRKFLGH